MRQAINFQLIRTGLLTGNEIAVLSYVNSFSSYCAPKRLQEISDSLQWSERKLRYVIQSLVAKGLLRKRYTYFKRVVLRLVDLSKQAELFGLKSIKACSNQLKTFKKNLHNHDRQKQSGPDRQKTTEPTKNKTQEEQKTTDFKKNQENCSYNIDPRKDFADLFSKFKLLN